MNSPVIFNRAIVALLGAGLVILLGVGSQHGGQRVPKGTTHYARLLRRLLC